MEILYNKAEAEQLLASLGVLIVILRFKRRQVGSRVSIEPRNFVKVQRVDSVYELENNMLHNDNSKICNTSAGSET